MGRVEQEVAGPNDQFDPISDGVVTAVPADWLRPLTLDGTDGARSCRVTLPDVAKALPVLGPNASLKLHVVDRLTDIVATAGDTR